MAGADDRKKKQSVEDFLFARLSLDDDEDDDDKDEEVQPDEVPNEVPPDEVLPDEPDELVPDEIQPDEVQSEEIPPSRRPSAVPAPLTFASEEEALLALISGDDTNPPAYVIVPPAAVEPDADSSDDLDLPLPSDDTQPFPSDDAAWSARLELAEEPAPPLPEPPPWERDTDPTPEEWELPAALPEDSDLFGTADRGASRPDGDTAPLPETQPFPPHFDEDPSEGPELSDPGAWALADATQEPEIEDLEEPSLSRGPAHGGGFDEVFPAWGLRVPDARRRGADEETNSLLQVTDGGSTATSDGGSSPSTANSGGASGGEWPTESRGTAANRRTPASRSRDHEPVGADPMEPATQWHRQTPTPRREIAEEKTDIRGFQPLPPDVDDDSDDAPTVIVPPPTNLRSGRDPTPRPLPMTPVRPTAPPPPPPPVDDPRTTAVIAWTASALGVLMFVAVLAAGTAVAWQYVGGF